MRNFTGQLATLVDTALGTNPSLIADFYWLPLPQGFETFGTKDYVNANGDVVIPGKILSVSGLQSEITLQRSVSNSVSLVLDDTDGHIKSILNTVDIHKVSVVLRHVYDETQDTTAANTVVLFFGKINSPIIWDEGSRTVAFDVVSVIEDKEVGFTPEQGQFLHLSDSSYGKTWPLAFGKVRKVPAVRLNARIVGECMTRYSIMTTAEWEDYINKYKEYLTKQDTIAEDLTDLDDNESNTVVTALSIAKNNWQDARRQLLKYHSVTEANLQSIESLIDDIRFDQKEIDNWELEQATLVNERLVLKKKNDPTYGILGDPTGHAQREERIQAIETELTTLKNGIQANESEILTKMGQLEVLRRTATGFNLTAILVSNGLRFPQNQDITLTVNDKKLRGSFSGEIFNITDSSLSTDDTFLIPTRSPANRIPGTFTVPNATINLKGKFLLISESLTWFTVYVKDQVGTLCYYTPSIYRKGPGNVWTELELDGRTVEATSPYVMGSWLSNTKIHTTESAVETGLTTDIRDADWGIEYGDQIVYDFWKYELHVFNCVPASYTPATALNGVFAYRKVKGVRKLVPVPSTYYTKVLNELVTNSTGTSMRVSYLKLYKKLSDYFGEEWEDEIFVSFTSGLSSNTADVISFLLSNYSNVVPDSGTFSTVQGYLTKYPSNFALLDRANVLDLVQSIAWQARCSVWIDQDVAKIKYLGLQYISVGTTITASDVEMRTMQIAHGHTEDIVTKLVATFRRDYAQEKPNTIIYRNNIAKYGEQRRDVDFFIYDRLDLVEKSASFWLLRYSNTFKKLRFKTFFKRLAFEINDTVNVNLPTVANSTIACEIDNIYYDPNDKSLGFELSTPVQSGYMDPYPLFWSGSSAVTYPSANDPYPGGSSAGYNVTGNMATLEFGSTPKDYARGNPADIHDAAADAYAEIGEVDYSPGYSDILRINTKKEDLRPKLIDVAKDYIIDSATGFIGRLKNFFQLKKGFTGLHPDDYPATSPGSAYLPQKNTQLVVNASNGSASQSDSLAPDDPQPFANLDIAWQDKDAQFEARVKYFTAYITYFERIAANRWKYSWTECKLETNSGNYNIVSPVNGRSGGHGNESPYNQHFAINLIELNNTGSGVEGNSINVDNIGNLKLQPVGGGGGSSIPTSGTPQNTVVVRMYEMRAADNKMFYAFEYENAIDGNC